MVDTATPARAVADDEDQVLGELSEALVEVAREERLLARRIDALRAGRRRGRSWQELLSHDPTPGTLELSGRALARLSRASATLRTALARGLRAEGASIPAIARTFGVSHQRVSALLRRHR